MPAPSVVLRLLRTYTCEAAFSPTSTTASPGTDRPAATRAVTCSLTLVVSCAARALPSMMRALMSASKKARSLPDLNHGPPFFPGQAGEGRIGIDSDRVRHPRQQRNVVARVAVEPAFAECRECSAALREPGIETRDLAFAHIGHALDLPGVAAGLHLRLGGDEVVDTQLGGDGCGEKAVRRGREHDQMSRGAVLSDERSRRGRNRREDPLRQIRLSPELQLRGCMRRKRRKIEFAELVDADLAALISLAHASHGRLEALAVERAVLHQELDPGFVRIDRE